MREIQGVRRLIADVDFELQSNNAAYLEFCLRSKSSISDHWSSHRVKERTGGHF